MSGFGEETVLGFLHRSTYVPGAVRVLKSGYAKDKEGNPIEEKLPFRGTQQLFQIMFADKGAPLSTCTSVYQFLRVIHDALSAQINMTGAIGVMHRNITDETIQVRDSRGPRVPAEDGKYKPDMLIAPYIKEILGEVKPEDNVSEVAECLITDFDHAVIFLPGLHEESLKEKTGTPMFLSRSVARTALLPIQRTIIFPPIPRLQGPNPLFQMYRTAKAKPHDYQTYNNFSNLAFHRHVNNKPDPKGKGKGKPVEPPSFKHSFVHEAESTLWVITSWLIHAIPVPCPCTTHEHPVPDPEGYVSSEAYQRICRILYLDPPESRDLIPAASEWHKFLHPHLPSSLATMLAEMHRYLRPEWTIFPVDNLRPDHAHEALRRLVFKEIARMKVGGAREMVEVERKKRAIPSDIKKAVMQQEEDADIMAMFGKAMNGMGNFMRTGPMSGDLGGDYGYEDVDDGDEDHTDDDEDEDTGEVSMDSIHETSKAATTSLPNEEPSQTQAQDDGKMDTD